MKNWQTKKLGELFEITSSKRVFKSEWKHEGVPFYRAREIVKLAKNGFVDNELFISEEMYHGYSKKYGIPKTGDIMITGVGTLGICYVVKDDDKFYFKDGNIIWLKTKNIIDSRLVEYAFKSDLFIKKIHSTQGATVGTLTIEKANNMEITFPSTSEQKRIVKILNEVFENIDKAKENTQKNLLNSKELFDSYSRNIFINSNNKWPMYTLDKICKVERGSSPRPIKQYLTNDVDGVNWIKIGDTKNINRYLCSTKQKITKEGAKNSRFVKEGDLILSNSMSFGKPYIMKTSGYIHDGWFVLRPNSNIDTEYFYDVIMSPQVQDQFKSLASGAIVKNISGDLTKKAVLPVPAISEQKIVVKKLDELSEQTKKLEENYKQKLLLLDELKKSVLAKAFSGNL